MDVFLGYSRRDATHAATLNAWLGSQDVTTFFDQGDLGAVQLWLPDLERRIEHDAQAVAVLVGPGGLGNTQQYEYQLALTRQATDPGFPVILPGTPDWRVPRGFLGLLTWISFASAADPLAEPTGLRRLLAPIRRIPAEDDAIRGTICPYKGLGFFEEADNAVFFGRDAEADFLLSTVTTQQVAALIGRFGSGKSSLGACRPAAAAALPPCAGVWDSLVIRPGEEPLADVLSPAWPAENPLDRRRRLRAQADLQRTDAPDILAGTLRDRVGAARLRVDRLLVVVDQAEELFTPPWRLTDADAIRQFHTDGEIFIRLLLEAAAQGPASVVLATRSDFFDPLIHSPFAPVLKDALVQLSRIADLRPSIERAGALVGLRFAPGLVGRIVEEVGTEESNLPLLQHALERTRQRRAGALLSNDAYVAAGGVAQAIDQAARDSYRSLSPGERDAARRVFLRLLQPGDATAPIRVHAAVPEDAEERHVMEAFAHPVRRLLFVGEQAGVPVVEVAHEALVRGRDTLRGWVETSREKLRVRDARNDWRTSAAINELIPAGSTLCNAPVSRWPIQGMYVWIKRRGRMLRGRSPLPRHSGGRGSRSTYGLRRVSLRWRYLFGGPRWACWTGRPKRLSMPTPRAFRSAGPRRARPPWRWPSRAGSPATSMTTRSICWSIRQCDAWPGTWSSGPRPCASQTCGTSCSSASPRSRRLHACSAITCRAGIIS
jgi:hypothetical protein